MKLLNKMSVVIIALMVSLPSLSKANNYDYARFQAISDAAEWASYNGVPGRVVNCVNQGQMAACRFAEYTTRRPVEDPTKAIVITYQLECNPANSLMVNGILACRETSRFETSY